MADNAWAPETIGKWIAAALSAASAFFSHYRANRADKIATEIRDSASVNSLNARIDETNINVNDLAVRILRMERSTERDQRNLMATLDRISGQWERDRQEMRQEWERGRIEIMNAINDTRGYGKDRRRDDS